MAHAARVLTSKPIPPHAVRCALRGKPAVKWKGRGNRWIVAAISATDPARCLLESRKWYAFFRDSSGKPAKRPGFEDKAATERLASDLETRAARVKVGILPPEVDRSAPLAVRLDRWRDDLVNDGATAEHANRQRRRVEIVMDRAKATRPADLTPVSVRAALADLQAHPPGPRPFGSNNAAHHVGAVKQFTRWLVLRDRSEPADPLAGLSREYGEPKLKRRSLKPRDFAKLVDAATTGRTVRRLTGVERAALYLVAASTGLRASELASLTTESFDLGKRPTVTVQGAYAKNRRTDTLPLPKSLVKVLRPIITKLKPGESVFPARGLKSERWVKNAAEMIAVDLTAADIPVVDAGRVYDFHALRVQFGSDLERAGVSLSRAQRLMRHSTPVLTSNIYTRPGAEEMAADVDRLRR